MMSNVVVDRGTEAEALARARRKSFIKRHGWSYLFITPSMLVFSIFTLIPVVWALVISFQDFDYGSSGTWVGIRNYVEAFHTQGGVFVQAIGNTLYYTVCTVSANVIIALMLAGLLQGRHKYVRSIFLAAFYLPAVTSVVIIALIWGWIFNADYGFLNYLIGLLHIPPVGWISNPDLALKSITLSTILTVPATGVVLFNAAMTGVPTEYYEAAKMDGAGPIRAWWSITLPLIRPTILYVLVLYTISSFEVFEKIFVMVPSGVGNSTQVIVTQIYQTGFQQFRYGVAAAEAFVLFLMIASVAAVQFRLLRSDVEY